MRERDTTYYFRYSEALAERFHSGVLEELPDYDHFVVWKQTPEQHCVIPVFRVCLSGYGYALRAERLTRHDRRQYTPEG
jgi:hypothetical protein